MKQLILLTLFCGSVFSGLSQTYHKLIKPGTYWDCSWEYNPYGGYGCATTIDRIFFTDADTLLEGITYKISYAYPMHSDPPNPGKCPPYAVDTVAVEYQKYIREDTIARKVYIYNPIFFYPSDQILYDFTLKPGDTLKSTYQGDRVVTAVDSVMISTGEYRKRFIFVVPAWGTGYYVEGVGGSQGLFTPMFTFESSGVFLCLQENNVNLWGNYCNSWFVNVPDHDMIRPIMYPNPATDKLTVEFHSNTEGAMVELLNLYGQRCFRINHPKNTERAQIDVSKLPPGFYFVRVTSGDRVIATEKVVVR